MNANLSAEKVFELKTNDEKNIVENLSDLTGNIIVTIHFLNDKKELETFVGVSSNVTSALVQISEEKGFDICEIINFDGDSDDEIINMINCLECNGSYLFYEGDVSFLATANKI